MKKILSTLLTLCILLALVGIAPRGSASAPDSNINQQVDIDVNSDFIKDILSEDEVSKYIDYEMALKAKHVERFI